MQAEKDEREAQAKFEEEERLRKAARRAEDILLGINDGIPDEEKNEVWTLRSNRCTRNGLVETLAPKRSSMIVGRAVKIDKFGKPEVVLPPGVKAIVPLEKEQAEQLSDRVEGSGYSFTVQPTNWMPTQTCPRVATLHPRAPRPTKLLPPAKSYEGRVQPGRWAYFEFEVEESWRAVEILCEARCGQLLVLREQLPDDSTYDPEAAAQESKLRRVWNDAELVVTRCNRAGDTKGAVAAQREASAAYKEFKDFSTSRVRCEQHRFSQQMTLYHTMIISKVGISGSLKEAHVMKPRGLLESQWVGKWVVGLRGEGENDNYPMDFRLGVRFTEEGGQFEEKVEVKEESLDDEELKKRAMTELLMKQGDMSGLTKVKWEKWNRVDLARALSKQYEDTFYIPKQHEKTPLIQGLVKRWLSRRRLKWLLQVSKRREILQEHARQVRESLSFVDKDLVQRFQNKVVPQELDDLRWAQSAATMLKFGNLNTPFMFRSAARAVFNVIDEDGSGAIEVTELRKGFKMMGLDEVPEHTLGIVIKAFDDDGSGEIDQDEFVKMTRALCNSEGEGGIEAALAEVMSMHDKKVKVVSPKKVVHEAGHRVNYDEMTPSQLVNNLEMLKLRLNNRC